MKRVLDAIRRKAASFPKGSLQRLKCLRDGAYFALSWASGVRATQLAQAKCSSVVRLPGDAGLLLNWMWGKTLRDGSMHVLGVMREYYDEFRRCPTPYCPCVWIEDYVNAAHDYGWDMTCGYLFANPGAPGAGGFCPKLPAPMSASNASQRFSTKLASCFGVPAVKGVSLHGMRVAFAIRTLLEGGSLRETMAKCLWRSPRMAEHYIKMYKVLALRNAGEGQSFQQEVVGVRKAASMSVKEYHRLNVSSVDENVSLYTRAWGGKNCPLRTRPRGA
jgi:integrase